mgnify:CR=1 FL=1
MIYAYYRVSTDEQDFENQKSGVVRYCEYKGLKINYFNVIGLLTGAMTGAPALGYAQSLSPHNDQASVTYATVYPLTMFLRVMAGQILVVLFCS